jgi:hypothetical protein
MKLIAEQKREINRLKKRLANRQGTPRTRKA